MKNRPEQDLYTEKQPISTRLIFTKAYNGSKANAVKAKCLDCCSCDRIEIRHCQAYTCPLWAVRPYQIKRSE